MKLSSIIESMKETQLTRITVYLNRFIKFEIDSDRSQSITYISELYYNKFFEYCKNALGVNGVEGDPKISGFRLDNHVIDRTHTIPDGWLKIYLN